jgi:glycosyltransferase involved in cell wall biosynthesis
LKILCLFAKYPEGPEHTNIVKDLALAMERAGHELSVATLSEKKFAKKTSLLKEQNIDVLRVKTGNMFNDVSKIEKFITTLLLPFQFYRSILKYYKNKQFDLIIAHTPFMGEASLIRPLKRKFSCKAILLLWDIFPQNAVDIGMIKKGWLYKWLKRKEKHMLKSYEYINCMSEGNKNYLLSNYDFIQPSSLVINYNWGNMTPVIKNDVALTRHEYGYSIEDKLCIFGGNVGLPQRVENLVSLFDKLKSHKAIKFLIVGQGTELHRFKCMVEVKGLENVKFMNYMERNKYENLVQCCNVGLISLDERFTVPNFPSKTTDYFKCGIPIFAMVDNIAYDDYGTFLTNEAEAGIISCSNNIEKAAESLLIMLSDEDELQKMGNNARQFFEKQLNVDKVVTRLTKLVARE